MGLIKRQIKFYVYRKGRKLTCSVVLQNFCDKLRLEVSPPFETNLGTHL